MTTVRREDRPVLDRGPDFPSLQQLVDRANGSSAVTVLVNEFTGEQAVPEHVHEVEEVLIVVAGECTVSVGGHVETARAGDAVIVDAGTRHGISHHSDDECTVVAVLGSPDLEIGPQA